MYGSDLEDPATGAEDAGPAEASEAADAHLVQVSSSLLKRRLWFSLGMLCVAIGIVGIGIPVLPTTDFMLLAAFCFFRSSQRMYDWVINNRIFGRHVRNFREHRIMPRPAKAMALSLMWIFVLFAIIWELNHDWAKWGTFGVAAVGSVYILRLPSMLL